MTDTNPPQEREATDPKEERRQQLMASLQWSLSRDAEIRDATLEVLYRFANLAPARPGETERDARFRGLENSARLDDVRAAMLDALERS
jgi:hypothetical protein